eukprot:CAMPEP_0113653514 /NCGR_PEP_ID=MMETSP0017_2-20120614/28626_1 /TAXON_ID=2856 /ORGANISM="Cylindrotheca closterium" /LENGTH=89 /DNA_ID=CAMNT_0000566525 /DNA_START=147 /DNA_END=413 /DNA_ORIENTATION=+ /assembly_acc=CAM_ASM_000147
MSEVEVIDIDVIDIDGKKAIFSDSNDLTTMNLLNRVKSLGLRRSYNFDANNHGHVNHERRLVGDLVRFLDMTSRRIDEMSIDGDIATMP